MNKKCVIVFIIIISIIINLYTGFLVFLDYLEVHKAQALKDREDYQTLNKKISELKYKYPNVRTFLEEKEPIDLRDDEQYAILNVLDYETELDVIELKESFKLGFKEALIYLNNMGMLKLN